MRGIGPASLLARARLIGGFVTACVGGGGVPGLSKAGVQSLRLARAAAGTIRFMLSSGNRSPGRQPHRLS